MNLGYFYHLGKYFFIETSIPRKKGEKARLVSMLFPHLVFDCLRFSYHMFGENIGRLDVYASTVEGLRLLWRRAGSQENGWRKATVPLVTGTAKVTRIDIGIFVFFTIIPILVHLCLWSIKSWFWVANTISLQLLLFTL